jgi:hypothetical protein
MTTKTYFVWNRAAGAPTYAHSNKQSAIAESERLAKQNPGSEFIVLVAIGASLIQPQAVFQNWAEAPKELPW